MVFKVDFIDGDAISWNKTESGVEATRHKDYHPRFYIEGDRSKLHKSRSWLAQQEGIVATCFETWKPTLSKPEKKVLRVDCSSDERLKKAVYSVKEGFGGESFRFYNVGFSPQFRFCLQNEICPVPENDLVRSKLSLHRKHLANGNIRYLQYNGERLGYNEEEVLENLKTKWKEDNPDIVQVSRGQVLKLIREKVSGSDIEFSLSRMADFQQLAGGNTVSSYGRTQHAAARYNIPSRIIIDESNSFMLGEATLEGLWDLVERSYRPLQELAWGSIGRLLTSIEIKKAYLEDNTLTPWKNWSRDFNRADKIHRADRGGFIFNPEPSIHFDVYEADYASLFPNIMVKRNISPETVCCDCCDNERTPELGYSICEKKEGFISKVLKPLVEDRQEMKEILREQEISEEREKYLEGSVDAIKWILVSCFGYMGHAHASYGSILCHQAIQAFDRDIMLTTKQRFEENGYSIAHGIIDSIWVQEKEEAKEFEEVCQQLTEEIGIELEPEYKFDWVAFVPRSSSDANIATLNRYFGRKANGEYKMAGIETEQRSTCEFIEEAQEEMIHALDRDVMNPNDVNPNDVNRHETNRRLYHSQLQDRQLHNWEKAKSNVLEVVQDKINKLEAENVPVENLIKTRKTSKPLEAYNIENRSVSALKRARHHGIDMKSGQSVKFVVRDDKADSMDRTRLDFEAEEGEYDPEFYKTELIRAAESILSPLGMDRDDIKRKLNGYKVEEITSFSV